jgi:crotonobetainyl-CoA:carnitine CoA-transferase CaiB-like acyl-CoA transferase
MKGARRFDAQDNTCPYLSGLASVQAGSDAAKPRLVRTILPDKLTGAVAAQAITAALLARARRAGAARVRLSMLDAALAFLWGSDMGGQTFAEAAVPQREAASFIDLIYETATRPISVAVQSDREWVALAAALGRPEWLEDPRFATPALRQRHIDERLALTQEALRARPAEEWLERLDAAGVPCAPALTRTEVLAHPQVRANGVVVEAEPPRRPAAPGAARGAVLRDPGRARAPGAGARRRHARGAGGGRAIRGRDRGARPGSP